MRGEEMDFHDVDRRYAELKRQYDSGTLAAEGCDSQLQQLMLQDGEGRWWAKNRESGEWYYHDGSTWIQDTPPGYQPVGPYYRQRVHDLPASDRETTWRTSSGAPAYQHNGLEANSLNIHVVGRRIMATLVDVLAIV